MALPSRLLSHLSNNFWFSSARFAFCFRFIYPTRLLLPNLSLRSPSWGNIPDVKMWLIFSRMAGLLGFLSFYNLLSLIPSTATGFVVASLGGMAFPGAPFCRSINKHSTPRDGLHSHRTLRLWWCGDYACCGWTIRRLPVTCGSAGLGAYSLRVHDILKNISDGRRAHTLFLKLRLIPAFHILLSEHPRKAIRRLVLKY